VAIEEQPHQLVSGVELGVDQVRENELRPIVEHTVDVGELLARDDRVVGPRPLVKAGRAAYPRPVALLDEREVGERGVGVDHHDPLRAASSG
jgi:hypothetical protein